MAANGLGNGIPAGAAGHGLVVGSGDEIGHRPQTVSLSVGAHPADSQQVPEVRGDLVSVCCPETALGYGGADDLSGGLGAAVDPAGGPAGDWSQDAAVKGDTGALVALGDTDELSTDGSPASRTKMCGVCVLGRRAERVDFTCRRSLV
ncbi:hypothetical protein [Arthrobacter luteolus]|uniref:hypothetical protein n=1 Tax=Arthrobacter luteolus TaxID=98672 RepID=UPI0012ED8663|nr:hypothetical protein [Arthrobacter luteolus]